MFHYTGTDKVLRQCCGKSLRFFICFLLLDTPKISDFQLNVLETEMLSHIVYSPLAYHVIYLYFIYMGTLLQVIIQSILIHHIPKSSLKVTEVN